MKLDEAKHILKESGCLLEKSDKEVDFTNSEIYELIDRLKEVNVVIEKTRGGYNFRNPDTNLMYGAAVKEKNNSWRAFIYDMEFNKTTLSLNPKDYYGPKSLNDLDADEIVEYLKKYNYIESYANDMKNKIANYLIGKFNLDDVEYDPTPDFNYK